MEPETDAASLENQMVVDHFVHQGSTSQPSENGNNAAPPPEKMDAEPTALQGFTSQNDNNAAPLPEQMDAESPALQRPSVQPAEKDNMLVKKFFVQLEGKTNGAHHSFVTKLKHTGHIVVDSLDKSDFLLVFCPIVSRVGTDISDALENIPDGKATILVVMHHTFKPDHVVAESRRLVEKPNIILTVDCLFYEGKLLSSNRNETAWFKIQELVGVPSSQASTSQPSKKDKMLVKKFFVQLEGKTNGAHQSFVTGLKEIGHIEVDSLDKSDFLLVFCPIVSRVGTDISDALENIPDGKATILVVMHHTFKPDHVVAESRRLVEKPNIKLTVDCLFYDGKLLSSNRNENAWFKIQELVGVPSSQPPQTSSSLGPLQRIPGQISSWVKSRFFKSS